MKEIKLPIGFTFLLKNKATGDTVTAPQAFKGYDWKIWKNIPDGIEYEIKEELVPHFRSLEYSVGGDARIIRWDPKRWQTAVCTEDEWAAAGWPIHPPNKGIKRN